MTFVQYVHKIINAILDNSVMKCKVTAEKLHSFCRGIFLLTHPTLPLYAKMLCYHVTMTLINYKCVCEDNGSECCSSV